MILIMMLVINNSGSVTKHKKSENPETPRPVNKKGDDSGYPGPPQLLLCY